MGNRRIDQPLGEVLQTIGGYGFHFYDDGGARWITIRSETDDAAKQARDLIAKALIRAISATVHGRVRCWRVPGEHDFLELTARSSIATVMGKPKRPATARDH
jgi:hypothetical protein